MECDLGNIAVHYETFGEGRPIIFLHGWHVQANHFDWSLLTEPFFENKNGWRRIYLDLPGMGKTPGADWITGSEDIVDLVIKFIDQLLPNQKVVLAGYSWGGYLAQGIIYKQPEIADGLCLVAPVTCARDERVLPEHTVLIENKELLKDLEPEIVELFQNHFVVQSRELMDFVKGYDQLGISTMGDEDFMDRIYEKYICSFNVEKLPNTFDKPTLIVTGRQDSATGYQNPWGILENYPRATYAVLDRSGHGLKWEQGDLLLNLIAEWLDRVEENINLIS
jgi:pimeloyl-ACP methyl ester carboxylesterase